MAHNAIKEALRQALGINTTAGNVNRQQNMRGGKLSNPGVTVGVLASNIKALTEALTVRAG